ncbi:hypothetical protein Tco_0881580 [Tanacetum coccineum]
MSCSNHHPNFSRKLRMSVRQVWKRKTSTPKSSPSSQKDSPSFPPRVHLQSPSPPSYNLLRDQMINQLHNISTILDSHTNPSNAYIYVPPSPPPQPNHPPSHAQVEFHLYLIAAGEKRMFQLHELDELRHQAYENYRLYKVMYNKSETYGVFSKTSSHSYIILCPEKYRFP